MMKNKKRTALIGAAIFSVSMFALIGNAQASYANPDDRVTITLGSGSGSVGDSVMIPVSLATAPQTPVAALINFYIQYDPTVLRFLDAPGYFEVGPGLSGIANLTFVKEMFLANEPNPGDPVIPGFLNVTVAENYDLQYGAIPKSGESVIVNIKFDIISDPISGTTTPLTILTEDPLRPGETPSGETTIRVLSPTAPAGTPPVQDTVDVPFAALNSGVVTVIDITAPFTTAIPPSQSAVAPFDVELVVNEPAATYYTTDGIDPTTDSAVYSTAIPITTNTTLKFFSVDTAGNTETVQIETYVIDSAVPVTTANIHGGHYSIAQTVSLTTDKTSATTYFSTDGNNPEQIDADKYVDPITLPADTKTTLKFFSVAGGDPELVKTETYKIKAYTMVDFQALVEIGLGSTDISAADDVEEDGVINTKDIGIMMSNWDNSTV